MPNPNPSPLHRFKPGQSGNPKGRPPGTGRLAALGLLDSILNEPKVQAVMRDNLREYFLTHPVQAFKEIVMPLLPKNLVLASPEGKPFKVYIGVDPCKV